MLGVQLNKMHVISQFCYDRVKLCFQFAYRVMEENNIIPCYKKTGRFKLLSSKSIQLSANMHYNISVELNCKNFVVLFQGQVTLSQTPPTQARSLS